MPSSPEEIKKAVKEALDDKAIQDLAQQNIALATQMSEGFSKVNTRLDLANGKLMKHDIKIAALEKNEKEVNLQTTFWERNQDKIVWGVVGIGLMLFYYLLTNNGFPAFLN